MVRPMFVVDTKKGKSFSGEEKGRKNPYGAFRAYFDVRSK